MHLLAPSVSDARRIDESMLLCLNYPMTVYSLASLLHMKYNIESFATPTHYHPQRSTFVPGRRPSYPPLAPVPGKLLLPHP